VGQLEDEFEVAVIAQRSNGEFQLHLRDDAVLHVTDRFVVSASIEALNRLARLTPPTRELDTYVVYDRLKPRKIYKDSDPNFHKSIKCDK